MKNILIPLLFIVFTKDTKAQTTFFKTISYFDEESNYVEQTTDGGYIIAGTGGNGYGAFAIKTDGNGDTIWSKIYGNSTSFLSGQQTSDGGYIFLGEIHVAASNNNIYVVKVDSFGNIQWQKSIDAHSEGRCIKQTTDGGYILTASGIYIIKLDPSGNIQWDNALSGINNNIANSVVETDDHGYMVAGTVYSMTNTQALLIKLNSSGIVQWSKTFGGSGYDLGNSIIKTSNNSYVFLGSKKDTLTNTHDMSLIKLDSSGSIIWSKYYKRSTTAAYSSISETNDGNYIISSYYYSYGNKMLLTLVDSNGNVSWSNFWGNNSATSFGKFARQTADGGYIFTGNTSTPIPGSVIYLIKTDSLGRSDCNDSSATLTVNPYTPTVNFPTFISTTGLSIANPSIIENNRTENIITTCISIGINEPTISSQISIYPNPAQNMINVKYESLAKDEILNIYDFTGKLISIQQLSGQKGEITLSTENYANGIYLCTLIDNSSISTKRLVIAR